MTLMSLDLDTKDLKRELKRMHNSNRKRMMKGVGSILEKGVKTNILSQRLVNTGKYLSSIHFHDATENEVSVSDGVDYGYILEVGSKPHPITPKDKKALTIPRAGGRIVTRGGKKKTSFKYGGKTIIRNVIFAKKVMHPGTKAYHPFMKGFHTVETEVINYVGEFLLSGGRARVS